MKKVSRRSFVQTALVSCAASACGSENRMHADAESGFICPPCGCASDHILFEQPGACPSCDMVLMPAVDPALGLAPTLIPAGAANFELEGSRGRYRVHAFRSPKASSDAQVLVVLPGAGRNANDYRNVWLETAMHQDLVVIALEFPESRYPLAAYNLGGVVRNLKFSRPKIERINQKSRVIRLNDTTFAAEAETDRSQWLFTDIRQSVDHIRSVLGLTRESFDVFGHSAGAQIAHRLVLFQPELELGRVVAANAGWYTFPDRDVDLPLGIANAAISVDQMRRVFAADLTVLLGEEDNNDGAGGTLLRSAQIDAMQGVHRFERGSRFFDSARQSADVAGMTFSWSRETVPGVGHNFREMSAAAAALLYPSY
ncbi:MAG: hypothetical protein AAF265_12035 [Pseudomonadota bacterium]